MCLFGASVWRDLEYFCSRCESWIDFHSHEKVLAMFRSNKVEHSWKPNIAKQIFTMANAIQNLGAAVRRMCLLDGRRLSGLVKVVQLKSLAGTQLGELRAL